MTSLCLAENFKTRKTRKAFIKSDASCLINWVSLDFFRFVLSAKHDESSLKAKAAKRWAKGGGQEVEVEGIFMFASLQNIKMMREIWQQTKHNKWGNKRDGYRNGREGERESKKEGEAQPVNELMVRGHSMTWTEQITCYKFDMLMTSLWEIHLAD